MPSGLDFEATAHGAVQSVVCHQDSTLKLLHGAVQSVVCHQDSTLKLLVVPLYVIICPIICFKGIKLQ